MPRVATAESIIEVQASAQLVPFESRARTAQVGSATGERGERISELPTPPASSISLVSETSRKRRPAAPPLLKPLAKARSEFETAFDSFMNSAWQQGNEALSNCEIGRRCGVNEKVVRGWRNGERPMPAAALALVPTQLFTHLVDYLSSLRKRPPRRALIQLRQALSDLESQLAFEDRSEVALALSGARAQIDDLMRKAVAT